MEGLGFRVESLGFRVWGLGWKVYSSGSRVQGLWFSVSLNSMLESNKKEEKKGLPWLTRTMRRPRPSLRPTRHAEGRATTSQKCEAVPRRARI